MASTVKCEIVSAEKELFSDSVEMIIAHGVQGDIGISPGHAPLLTQLSPGPIRLIMEGGEEEHFYVSGGMLEVQPKIVTVLADSAAKASDLSEAAAEKAMEEARKELSDQQGDIDYSAATARIAEAAAQIRTVRQLKRKLGK